MQYLIVNYDGDEIFYELSDIDKIICDYAQKLLSEVDLHGNDIKPLEMLTVIYFQNGGNTATYNTAKLEMSLRQKYRK